LKKNPVFPYPVASSSIESADARLVSGSVLLSTDRLVQRPQNDWTPRSKSARGESRFPTEQRTRLASRVPSHSVHLIPKQNNSGRIFDCKSLLQPPSKSHCDLVQDCARTIHKVRASLKARTEVHGAFVRESRAESHLIRGRYKEADAVMLDAERHFRIAQCAITIEISGSTLDGLADLGIKHRSSSICGDTCRYAKNGSAHIQRTTVSPALTIRR
jgi:hypothetical protein